MSGPNLEYWKQYGTRQSKDPDEPPGGEASGEEAPGGEPIYLPSFPGKTCAEHERYGEASPNARLHSLLHDPQHLANQRALEDVRIRETASPQSNRKRNASPGIGLSNAVPRAASPAKVLRTASGSLAMRAPSPPSRLRTHTAYTTTRPLPQTKQPVLYQTNIDSSFTFVAGNSHTSPHAQRVHARNASSPNLASASSNHRATHHSSHLSQSALPIPSPSPVGPIVKTPAPSRTQTAIGQPELAPSDVSSIVKQPVSQNITQFQLAAEVKAIYHALVQIEAKCVSLVAEEFNNLGGSQGTSSKVPPKSADQWQALITLHRTLLHEHHDFFLASQHPAASQGLRDIATKYSMPARMWKHGIHNFLELLRRHLPASLDFMLAFIYLAYQMMALLFETVPSFEETWIECLGDLGRYRMAIEEDDYRDREVWTGVARFWYSKAVDKNPNIGRLYHHLAILARSNAVQQLSLYGLSFTAVQPFQSTRGSIMTLLKPMMEREEQGKQLSGDTWLVKVHGNLFTNGPRERFHFVYGQFTMQLIAHVARLGVRWREQGSYIAITNITAFLGWGTSTAIRSALMHRSGLVAAAAGKRVKVDALPNMDTVEPSAGYPFRERQVLISTMNIVLGRLGDQNVLNFVHLTFVMIKTVLGVPEGLSYFNEQLPLDALAAYLNSMMELCEDFEAICNDDFPVGSQGARCLPEDYCCRGQLWSIEYLPAEHFDHALIDEDERRLESPMVVTARLERVLWLGVMLSKLGPSQGPWLDYDADAQSFAVVDRLVLARK